jgi:pimeloyl-ACP methyl ester carboxylesterase
LPKKIINLKWVFNYTVSGKGTPIVLLHGLGGHPTQWHEYVTALKNHHTVIVPNLSHLFYGYERISFSNQVEVLKDFLDHIGKEFGVLTLVGQSYGGTLACGVAVKEKDLVDRIILINPIPQWPIQHLRSSFFRFFMRTSAMLSQLKIGLLRTQVGIQFLRELQSVFPWRWLSKMLEEQDFGSRRFQMFHIVMERIGWVFQKENWDQWSRWQIPSERSLLIYDPKDPLFNPLAYKNLMTKLNIEHVISLKHSGHVLVSENKFEIQLGIRRFMEAGYANEFKIKPEASVSQVS